MNRAFFLVSPHYSLPITAFITSGKEVDVSESVFTTKFAAPRHLDVSVQLDGCLNMEEAIKKEGAHQIFIEFARLYKENELVKLMMDKYDISIWSPRYDPDGKWNPIIHFETTKAKLAREACAYGG